MFKHIAINSKCSENSGSYQKPGLENLEHWKALTLAQHQPCCTMTIQEQLEISAVYQRTTEISRESQKNLIKANLEPNNPNTTPSIWRRLTLWRIPRNMKTERL